MHDRRTKHVAKDLMPAHRPIAYFDLFYRLHFQEDSNRKRLICDCLPS